jgi:hypothetical protein
MDQLALMHNATDMLDEHPYGGHPVSPCLRRDSFARYNRHRYRGRRIAEWPCEEYICSHDLLYAKVRQSQVLYILPF